MEEINLCGRPGRCCPMLKMDRKKDKFKVYDKKPKNGKPWDSGWKTKKELLDEVQKDKYPVTFHEKINLVKALE